MKTINFNSIYNYFVNIIQSTSAELYESGLIEENLTFRFFNNTGEYINVLDDEEQTPDEVLVNILNNGGVQDSTIAIDTYLQMVSFEILARDDHRLDIMTLFTKIVANYKSKVDILSYDEDIYDPSGNIITSVDKSSTIQVTISDFPKFEEKFDLHGYDHFITRFDSNIIVFPTAYLSNQYKIYLEGEEIMFNSFTMARNTETTPDLKKRDTLRFYSNTTGFQIQISGLFVDNPALMILLEDCANNTKFNQTYRLAIKRPDGKILTESSFYAKDTRFDFKFGSIIGWSATFYLAESL